jgi:short-subunit dehydrogenase
MRPAAREPYGVQMSTALVTGATSGIGRAFAQRLAADDWHVVLVARDGERLARIAADLGVADVLVADLSTAEGRRLVQRRLADRSDPIEMLVNNAGYGLGESYLEADPAVEEAMFEVNAHAVMALTRTALTAMVSRGAGSIINVSSVAAWVPRGTYAATKAFVLSLSRSAAIEAAPYGVAVQALCPGLTHTEFHARSGSDAESRTPRLLWLSPERVVDESFKALAKGRTVCIPGRRWRLMMLATRLVPARLSVAMAKRGNPRRAQPNG